MAKGDTHDRINLLSGAIIAGIAFGVGEQISLVATFSLGWLIATLLFSPDTDLGPKKRTRLLQFVLYPYAILFRHRGISHSILLGTITRIFYVCLALGIILHILQRMGYLAWSAEGYFSNLFHFIKNYNYSLFQYKIITWFYAGMFFADLLHILLDRICDFTKKIIRFFN